MKFRPGDVVIVPSMGKEGLTPHIVVKVLKSGLKVYNAQTLTETYINDHSAAFLAPRFGEFCRGEPHNGTEGFEKGVCLTEWSDGIPEYLIIKTENKKINYLTRYITKVIDKQCLPGSKILVLPEERPGTVLTMDTEGYVVELEDNLGEHSYDGLGREGCCIIVSEENLKSRK